jgi:hypothetical protein
MFWSNAGVAKVLKKQAKNWLKEYLASQKCFSTVKYISLYLQYYI